MGHSKLIHHIVGEVTIVTRCLEKFYVRISGGVSGCEKWNLNTWEGAKIAGKSGNQTGKVVELALTAQQFIHERPRDSIGPERSLSRTLRINCLTGIR